mmetsp:Transcript_150578/g.419678  ORF Transcript_150578/g.419678 Transcript_150578/m.419678 type:complete len:309 (+) Transcript_150578:329-1255(+)
MARVEVDLEPEEHGIGLALPLAHHLVCGRHLEALLRRAVVEVDVQDACCGGQELRLLEGAHHRLAVRGRPHRREVETPDVAKVLEVALLVRGVLQQRQVELGAVREEEAAGLQPPLAGGDHVTEPGLIEQEVAHPFGDDHVDLLDAIRQPRQLAGPAADELQHLRPEAVVPRDARAHGHELRLRLEGDDLPGARPRREQRAQAEARADVKDHRAPEEVRVLTDGALVGGRGDGVLEHVLVHAVMVVRVEIIVGGRRCKAQRRPLAEEGLSLCLCRIRLAGGCPCAAGCRCGGSSTAAIAMGLPFRLVA